LVSLLLCIGACVLWVRSRTEMDQWLWSYIRWLPDKSCASNQAWLKSDFRLELGTTWGHVEPYNGRLVWGYYVSADQSGGHPRFTQEHRLYNPMELWMSGNKVPWEWVPMRFVHVTRHAQRDGDDSTVIAISLAHWFAIMLPLILPAWSGWRRIIQPMRRRRASARGLCPKCGYDLRASPDRCPECGAVVMAKALERSM
jgi:hypothetical protein